MTGGTAASPIEISVVIPCLNEIENVANIAAAVGAQLTALDLSYEIVFIDNASSDGTVEAIKALCAGDPRIRLIANNKNYGQMRSPTHAIYQTVGCAVIGICADFQDPPELIPEFVRKWRSGTRIVLGVRASERMSPFMRLLKTLGYEMFARFSDYRVIEGATGFGLYDRAVVESLKRLRDPEPFFRGMLVESGYSLETIPYARPDRAAGRSKNSVASLLTFGLSGVATASTRLLSAPFPVAVLTAALSGLLLVASIIMALFGKPPWLCLVAALNCFLFSLIFIFLGFIGAQLRMIGMISRNVPLVIEKERVNFPEDSHVRPG